MSVKPPKAGEVIEKADVEDMFDVVRNTVNNLKQENLGRATFGPQHFNPGKALAVSGSPTGYITSATTSGILEESDSASFDYGDMVTITAGATNETTWNGHTDISPLQLNGSGSGYALHPGMIVVYYSLRIKNWTTDNHWHWFTMFGGSYKINGGAETMAQQSVNVVRNTIPTLPWAASIQEDNVSFWYCIDTSARTEPFILTELNLLGAKLSGGTANGVGGTAFTSCDPQIAGGYHMFLSFKSHNY